MKFVIILYEEHGSGKGRNQENSLKTYSFRCKLVFECETSAPGLIIIDLYIICPGNYSPLLMTSSGDLFAKTSFTFNYLMVNIQLGSVSFGFIAEIFHTEVGICVLHGPIVLILILMMGCL